MSELTRRHFKAMHAEGCFVMPNPWDAGSAKLLASLGFPALATTSSGLAASLGKRDQHGTCDELVTHIAAITAAVDLPINADSERMYSDTLEGIAITVERLAEAGAAGCSIEDYDPLAQAIDPLGLATERVAAAAAAANTHGVVLTARAEGHLSGEADLDRTIARLIAFRDAGADVVYAPGLVDIADITHAVEAVGVPLNVLANAKGPSVPELAAVGVRRVSTGGALAWAAYGAMMRGALELLETGTSTYTSGNLPVERRVAFD